MTILHLVCSYFMYLNDLLEHLVAFCQDLRMPAFLVSVSHSDSVSRCFTFPVKHNLYVPEVHNFYTRPSYQLQLRLLLKKEDRDRKVSTKY